MVRTLLLLQLWFSGTAHAASDPAMCVNKLVEDLDAAVRSEAVVDTNVVQGMAWLRSLLDACHGGDCMPLADALNTRPTEVKTAAPHFVISFSRTGCAVALYEAMCSAGTRQACATLGNMYLDGFPEVQMDRGRALQFLTTECELRGGDCARVARDVRNRFYARHLVAVSGYFGFDGGDHEETSLPLGGELSLLRTFGDWKSTAHKRDAVFGLGVAAQGEYATGHTRVGANLSALIWQAKLRVGYVAELDDADAGRRDARVELVLSAPWAQAPLRMVFRGDMPVASRDGDASARIGFLVEVGWNFGLDGHSPRLRDFGFPFF